MEQKIKYTTTIQIMAMTKALMILILLQLQGALFHRKLCTLNLWLREQQTTFFRLFGNKTFQKSRTTALCLAIVRLEEFALIALHTLMSPEKLPTRKQVWKGAKSMEILILNYSQQRHKHNNLFLVRQGEKVAPPITVHSAAH
jgi:hypothetical protein